MLTGDWQGVRTRLKNAGIDLRAEYLWESAANPSGGRSQAVRYTQQVDFGLDLDLGRFLESLMETFRSLLRIASDAVYLLMRLGVSSAFKPSMAPARTFGFPS